MDKKGKKKERGKRTAKKEKKYKLIFDADLEGGEEDVTEAGGMFLGKEDVQLIYNALKEYKPVESEENLHSVLLESFEEILVVTYGEPYPDAN